MRVHFIGIGGVGMAGLAVLVWSRGHEVSGCDLKPTPRTDWLTGLGIRVEFGHDPRHAANADMAVVTPAVDRDNPELKEFRRRGLTIRYRGELLAEIVSSCDSIAVCGSHGKTTTSTFIARLLKALGDDPSWCIGGETGAFPVAGIGKGPLVVEADESDGTLALYQARCLVVNKCEYDHPDHFKTPADYFACYEAAKRNAGAVVDSENLPMVAGLAGLDSLAPHNRTNARAAVEVALMRGHSLLQIAERLPAIVAELPDRRFQLIAPGVYTDYAHHPTEMKCAVEMARKVCKGKLRVLFQPHRYSRTKALLADFAGAFVQADEVVICPTYAAFEHPILGGTSADLYAELRRSNVGQRGKLFLAESCAAAWTHARRSMQRGDVTLLLGAGDIIALAGMVKRDETLPVRKVWIGMGANTVKTDLNLGIEYVKTNSPAGRPGITLLQDPVIGPRIPWMAGIPGTIGGWVKMNAGAFGHSISEVIAEVKVDGKWIPRSECGFGYRTSRIEGEIQDVRWENRLRVEKVEGWRLKVEQRNDNLCSVAEPKNENHHCSTSNLQPPTCFPSQTFLERRKKFPPGTWGSMFKNPPEDFAGRLLESVGAKEMSVGGARVWSEHANVIVAGEGATSSDVLALAKLMQSKVRHLTGVNLEFEVKFN